MNRMRPLVLLLAVAVAACSDDTADPLLPPIDATGEAPVQLLPSGSGLAVEGGIANERHVVEFTGERIPPGLASAVAALGGEVESSFGPIGVAVVTGLDDQAAATLARRNDVRTVSPDHLIALDPPGAIQVAGGALVPASPDDPAAAFFYPRQWNMSAIGADRAWEAGNLGSPGVTVAILDSGIDYTHEDLQGLVDLSRSVSFVPPDDALVQAFFPGAHPIADLRFHGTHVAATVSSNGWAAAGVTSRTTLIGVKVCDVNGLCPTSSVLAGIMYAADAGADIMNLSLGGLFLKSDNPGFVSVINRAITYANRQGSVIVVAAGNAAVDLDRDIHPTLGPLPSLYAAYCDAPLVVCVSATGPGAAAGLEGPWSQLDTRAEYSNFGRSAISVSAPGGRGGLTENGGLVWAACSGFSLVIPVCQGGGFAVGLTGTSMAAPHASGVAALVAADSGPRTNPARIRSRLQQTADDVGPRGTDPFFGKGRVNAARAVGLR